MARITHPTFTPGRSKGLAGIEFIDGFAEVDLGDNDILRQALAQHGYGIEEYAIAELPDGTVIGDGKSLATLRDDSGDVFAEADSTTEAYIPAAPARRGKR